MTDAPPNCSPQAEQTSAKTIELLSRGVLEIYEPPLATIKTHLKDLTSRQESLHAALVTERKKLEDLQSDAVSDALIANVAMSRDRLVAISSSMVSLHKRVRALQARAANIEKAAKTRAGK